MIMKLTKATIKEMIREELDALNEANIIQKIDKLAKANKYGTVDGTQMNGKTAREIIAMFKHPKMNSHRNQMLKMKSHELVDLSIRLLKPLKIKVESVNEAKFSKDQIEIMKMAYGTLSGMNPSSPTYKKFIKYLEKLPKDQLKQLIKNLI